MSFPIRLNSVLLRTLVTLPFLLSVLSRVVFLNPCLSYANQIYISKYTYFLTTLHTLKIFFNTSKISQCSAWIMVNTTGLRTYIDLLLGFRVCPLFQFPWQVVSSPVQLQVLISLKSFVTYLTYISICS